MTGWHNGYVHLLYTVYIFGEHDYISRNICNICVCMTEFSAMHSIVSVPLSESETTSDTVLLYLASCSCSKCYCGACTVMLSFCFIFNRFFHMGDKTCKMLIMPRGSLWPCWILVNVYFADIIKGNTGTNCIKSILLVPFCMASCRISCLAWSLEVRELLVRNSFTF